MYIAFDLVNFHHLIDIQDALDEWQEKYDIPYQIKTVKKVTRVVFASDELYSFFALSWNPPHAYLKTYRVVEPMKLDHQ
jgi:hypothetical protein